MSMERAKFKERMKALKAYKNETGKGYWDWKVQAFDGGGDVEQIGEKEIQWFKDWYNKRMEYAIANNRPDIVKQLESLQYYFYPEPYKYSLGVPWDNSIYTSTLEPKINKTKISINDQAVKDYEKEHGIKIGGYQHPAEGIVLPSNYSSSDLLHELAHIFNSSESVTNAVNSAISDENGFVSFSKGLQNSDYWISPWEVHSRLMQFRKENNIDPIKVYNEEDIKQLRKSAKDERLFEIFDDSQMMHLLNDVAHNATTSTDDRLFLKNGGMVPAYTDGTDGDDDKLYTGRTDQDYYGNLTHNIVVDTNGDEVNFGLPDIVITPKNNLSLGTYNYNKKAAKNVADVASFIPGVGEVIDATVAAQDASEGDYTTAAGLGLGLFIPNVIEKPLKWMWKGGKKIMQNGLPSVADLMENHSPQGRFAVGFANDLLTQPSRTFKALREGTYPTSYTKVSQQVRKLHEELLDKKIAHWNMVTNDFDRNVQLRIDMLNGELPDASDFDILSHMKNRIHNTFFRFPEYIVGRSFRNHGGSSSLLGFHDDNKAVTKARHRTNFIDIDDIVGTSVHERQHEINKILPYYDDLTAYSPSADYYTVSGDGEHFITDVFKFQNASVVDATEKGYQYETWQSSPSEFLAELAKYRVMFADGRNYFEMAPEQREKIAEKMTSRFYTPMTAYYSGKTDDELQTIMMDKLKTLGVFGYSDGGIVGKKKLKRSLKNKQKENKSN